MILPPPEVTEQPPLKDTQLAAQDLLFSKIENLMLESQLNKLESEGFDSSKDFQIDSKDFNHEHSLYDALKSLSLRYTANSV